MAQVPFAPQLFDAVACQPFAAAGAFQLPAHREQRDCQPVAPCQPGLVEPGAMAAALAMRDELRTVRAQQIHEGIESAGTHACAALRSERHSSADAMLGTMAKATRQDAETALRLLGLDTLSPTQKETASLIALDWRNAGRSAKFQTDGYALALVRQLGKQHLTEPERKTPPTL
jgi:hypothetical protein